jgi:type II secretory pathway component GspD/PulD (secretin)
MSKPRTPLLRHLLTTLLVAAACATTAVHAQTGDPAQQAVVEIVRLQHRDPDTIRRALEPVLDPRGAISQIDNNLIVSTSRANLQQLQAIVQTLDVPLRRLRLSVDFAYTPGAAAVSANGSSVTTVQTTAAADYPRQSIVLTEGEYAYFSRSDTSARVSPTFGSHGLQLQQDLQRRTQSVSVTAHVQGERVQLELRATRDTPAGDGTVRSELVNTTLQMGFNGWYVVFDPAPVQFAPNLVQTSTAPWQALAVQVELLP